MCQCSLFVDKMSTDGDVVKWLNCHDLVAIQKSIFNVCSSFTPDFSLSRIQRVLTIHTSLAQPINFTLQATVPSHLLTKCSAALPRPSWEAKLYPVIVFAMAAVFVCVVVAAYFEAHTVLTGEWNRVRARNALLADMQSSESINSCKIFDLKNLDNDLTVPSGGASPSTGGHAGNSVELRHRFNGIVQHHATNRKQESTSTYIAPVHHPIPAPPPRQVVARHRRRDNTSTNYLISLFYKSLAYVRRVFKWPPFKWSWFTRGMQLRLWSNSSKSSEGSNNKKSYRNTAVYATQEKESKVSSSAKSGAPASGDTGKNDSVSSRHGSNSNSTSNTDVSERHTRSKQREKVSKHQFPDLIEDVARAVDKSSKNAADKSKSEHKKNELIYNGCHPTEIRPDIEAYEKKGSNIFFPSSY